MNTLQLCGSFDPYYAGRKNKFASVELPGKKPDPKPADAPVLPAAKKAGKRKAVSDRKG
ncbi:hypothetical protein [Mesorhizobium sp. ZC-5]|uniref:hypothetical protein n=1 Tax=Mesorhizobium sp. ZC-5 TaxID=2986066 RepID=UPI0021E820BA|nr:hypothetical protein [Mesorhizobium sp. ZC-5]MCV3239538.1 hypothetical protein [Mesorhizobium sp. ZC-5]